MRTQDTLRWHSSTDRARTSGSSEHNLLWRGRPPALNMTTAAKSLQRLFTFSTPLRHTIILQRTHTGFALDNSNRCFRNIKTLFCSNLWLGRGKIVRISQWITLVQMFSVAAPVQVPKRGAPSVCRENKV